MAWQLAVPGCTIDHIIVTSARHTPRSRNLQCQTHGRGFVNVMAAYQGFISVWFMATRFKERFQLWITPICLNWKSLKRVAYSSVYVAFAIARWNTRGCFLTPVLPVNSLH